MRIAVLTGGVGGAKLALGLYRVMDPRDLTVIANTGDDIVLHGLHISPDPDILIYTLAGVVNPATGWGFEGETFRALDGLKTYGREAWFNLGDRDLATHIHRSAMMREGATLSAALRSIRLALGVKAEILPMSDQYVPTMLTTEEGRLHLQEYFVRRKCEPVVSEVKHENVADAFPAPGVMEAIADADVIAIAPSNPLISIGPILAVPAVREALRKRRERVVCVCPLVGGRSLKGPTDKMMRELGLDVSVTGVARLYADCCGTMVIDEVDGGFAPALAEMNMRSVVCSTVMHSMGDRERLARDVLRIFAA